MGYGEHGRFRQPSSRTLARTLWLLGYTRFWHHKSLSSLELVIVYSVLCYVSCLSVLCSCLVMVSLLFRYVSVGQWQD